ncbi:endonuclease/exonuclease/phosphatase family protein [Xanthocytophaga agilis]|uniref:Endonuclease/exonuclease/phosphatase family protein n=1 Tax=Xanthocytophaga agilis TaxID=3048010 RepID=A0AAE3RDE6_9BACT|nr:endonuclease/exonuclease/phosphatase family protein [Xanthocytophaga agilis]MDJ1506359.1 endonuclease/exonuclease/phosphatase family protein [Xanthocytophaga agilis]
MNSRKHITLFILFLLMLTGTENSWAQDMIVGSFNLRFDNPRDTGNLWVNRAPVVASLIRFHEFDIFGTQEGLKNQLDDISKALPEYERYGVGRDDGKEAGEHSAIFFRKDRFTILKKGDFWLSETPDKPTLGWDATCCKRLCSWVYLQDKLTKKKFYFFNAHFDHQGKIARVESGKLILKKIKEMAGNEPTLFTGDLNGGHQSEWYLTLANSGLLKDTFSQVKEPYTSGNPSFNSFGKGPVGNDIIDHVFATKDFQVSKWGVLTDTYRGKYPSDHFPILVKMKLK